MSHSHDRLRDLAATVAAKHNADQRATQARSNAEMERRRCEAANAQEEAETQLFNAIQKALQTATTVAHERVRITAAVSDAVVENILSNEQYFEYINFESVCRKCGQIVDVARYRLYRDHRPCNTCKKPCDTYEDCCGNVYFH